MPLLWCVVSRHASAVARGWAASGERAAPSVIAPSADATATRLRNNLARRQLFGETIEEFLAVVVRLDQHALVLAVRAIVVRVAEEPRDAVARDADRAQVLAVGRAGTHGRNHEHVRAEHLARELLDRLHDLGRERRRR